jgi:single-strand DNA-binding protein
MSISNIAILTGLLGADAEVKEHNGSFKITFSIATNDSYKDKESGEYKDNTTWHQCELWMKKQTNLVNILKKGNQLQILGSIKNRTFEKPGGEKGYWSGIAVKEVDLLSTVESRKGGSSGVKIDKLVAEE